MKYEKVPVNILKEGIDKKSKYKLNNKGIIIFTMIVLIFVIIILMKVS